VRRKTKKGERNVAIMPVLAEEGKGQFKSEFASKLSEVNIEHPFVQ
jgi:hypothetical protein